VEEVPGKVMREQMGEGKPVLHAKPEAKPGGEREKDQRVAARARKHKLADDKRTAEARKQAKPYYAADGTKTEATPRAKPHATRRRTP